LFRTKDGDYSVIIDRISGRSFEELTQENTALTGTNVINNPFWWSADDKF
jgi:hypothetical protein